jgi:hypothetical protein
VIVLGVNGRSTVNSSLKQLQPSLHALSRPARQRSPEVAVLEAGPSARGAGDRAPRFTVNA